MQESMKNHFLQLHLLTSYPPANLNRDDLGRPKTAFMGGALRLRVSSQSLKRAWRTSEVFEAALAGNIGTRTKEMGVKIFQSLEEKGVSEKNAKDWARTIAGVFGKIEKEDTEKPLKKQLEIAQLAHFAPEEEHAIEQLIVTMIERGSGPEDEELNLLRKDNSAADISLFGRMLADSPAYNIEAAAQVAHAIAVHRCVVEDDFFTAVDDLNAGNEDMGAGHLGETDFGSAVFYIYICIDRRLLLENLQWNRELTDRTLKALLECATTVAPGGHQNSFASRAYASYLLAEKGDRQPRSLSVSFLKPVEEADFGDGDLLEKAIKALNKNMNNMDKVYGPCVDSRQAMNALTGEGSLAEMLQFITED
jgi:CRISPR system Cascade subunit CasC